MKIGYRVTAQEEIGRYPADLIQISYWKTFGPDLEQIREIAFRARELGIPFVLHPVFTPLSETRPGLKEKNLEELTVLAEMTDLGLIVHDEVGPGRGRLSGPWLEQYRQTYEMLSSFCPVSIENATNTEDIDWFWNQMGGSSITLDMGHFESSGIDSVRKIQTLSDEVIHRVEYVHMHRKNGMHGGILDHWPLTPDCPEVLALRELLERKNELSLILEVNDMDQVGESLQILRNL